MVNEVEFLREVLAPRSFSVIRPEEMTHAEQIERFSSARVVVTPLGSSMANLVYCRRGAQIVEILNPRCVQTGALAIASQLQLDYHVVLACGVDPRQHEILEDLRVPVDGLANAVERALERC